VQTKNVKFETKKNDGCLDIDNEQALGQGLERDHGRQEFYCYHVRPESARRIATNGQQRVKHAVKAPYDLHWHGENEHSTVEIVETNVDEDKQPYYGYPKFMDNSMDHFGRCDQFKRWIQDDHLAHLESKERREELLRMTSDDKYRQLLEKRFSQQQVKKARDNGFYMD